MSKEHAVNKQFTVDLVLSLERAKGTIEEIHLKPFQPPNRTCGPSLEEQEELARSRREDREGAWVEPYKG